jgi:hypothetical protein
MGRKKPLNNLKHDSAIRLNGVRKITKHFTRKTFGRDSKRVPSICYSDAVYPGEVPSRARDTERDRKRATMREKETNKQKRARFVRSACLAPGTAVQLRAVPG